MKFDFTQNTGLTSRKSFSLWGNHIDGLWYISIDGFFRYHTEGQYIIHAGDITTRSFSVSENVWAGSVWKAQVISNDKPWIAVVIANDDMATRKEIFCFNKTK